MADVNPERIAFFKAQLQREREQRQDRTDDELARELALNESMRKAEAEAESEASAERLALFDEFTKECVHVDDGLVVKQDELYTLYLTWCRIRRDLTRGAVLVVNDQSQFDEVVADRLKAEPIPASYESGSIRLTSSCGCPVPGWSGIGLKADVDLSLPETELVGAVLHS